MYYFVAPQSPKYRQITLEDFLFNPESIKDELISKNVNNTRTFVTDSIGTEKLLNTDVSKTMFKLGIFADTYKDLIDTDDKSVLYNTFYIPKKSGGYRRIDEPNERLMTALRLLKDIFEMDFKAHTLYHTSAFAYIKGRSTIDALKRHQQNESKWFGKWDFKSFFTNTTLDYVMESLKKIYPFSVLCVARGGEDLLRKVISLAFLNGGLPQGTPISPMITNIIMIPIDHELSNGLRNFAENGFVYTRYADDILISSRKDFDINKVEEYILSVLSKHNAPFTINKEKTRYGSSAGRNWNLGLMLNKDNEITIGSKKKRLFKAAINSFILDTINGKPWDLSDIQVLEGQRSYYSMVEKESIENIISAFNKKYNVDTMKMIKIALSVN